VAEYLRAEVLAGQLPQLRAFLLRTGLVDELTTGLAGALAPGCDAPRLLALLRDQNLFLDEPTPGRYRYHPVLRDFLRAQATAELGPHLPVLHLRAAHYLERAGAGLAGARHALAAGDRAGAANALLPVAATEVFGAERGALLDLIDAVTAPAVDPTSVVLRPSTTAAADPRALAALHALAAAARGTPPAPHGATLADSGAVPADSGAAESPPDTGARPGERRRADSRRAGTPPTDPAVLRTLRQVSELLAVSAAIDPAGVQHCAGRLVDAPDGAGSPLATAAWLHLGLARLWRGQTQPARLSLIAAGRAAAPVPVRRQALAHRALLAALLGAVREAEDLLDEESRLGGPPDTPVAALVAAAYLDHLRGEPVRGQLLDTARATATGRADLLLLACVAEELGDSAAPPADPAQVVPPLFAGWSTVNRAAARLAAGDAPGALALLEPLVRRRGAADLVTGRARVVAARARLATGEPAQARSLLAPVHAAAPAVGPATSVAGWLAEALAADRQGAAGTVRVALTAALRTAAEHHLRAPFRTPAPLTRDQGDPRRALGAEVTRLLGRRGDLDGVDPQFVAALVAAAPAEAAAGGPASPANGPVEPVTERESVVLRYLPSLLTVVDIAGELGVSPNTVKTQMKSLYRKLAVENRRGAVQRARQLGLL